MHNLSLLRCYPRGHWIMFWTDRCWRSSTLIKAFPQIHSLNHRTIISNSFPFSCSQSCNNVTFLSHVIRYILAVYKYKHTHHQISVADFKHSHGIRAFIGLTSHDPNGLQLIRIFFHPSSFQHHDSHGHNQALLLQLSSMEESASSSSWQPRSAGSCGWHPCAATTIWSSHLSDTKQQSPSMESNWPAAPQSSPLLYHRGGNGWSYRPLHIPWGLDSLGKHLQPPLQGSWDSSQRWPSIDEARHPSSHCLCPCIQGFMQSASCNRSPSWWNRQSSLVSSWSRARFLHFLNCPYGTSSSPLFLWSCL